MLEGKIIICFASGYDAPPTSKHHVMHILSEKNTVLWVNYHASRSPTTSASDLRYMAEKLWQIAEGLKCPRKNVYVLTPLVMPLPNSSTARLVNRFLLISQIKLALKRIRKGPVQIWSFTPDVAYALGYFGEEKVVYYCVDDHASFSGYDEKQVLEDEEALCRSADLVITTSTALQKAKRPWNPNTLMVPHGVDFSHFSRAVFEELPCPKDISTIDTPRIGFFGLIRDWVDIDLIAAVARKRPMWNFILIGDADSSVDIEKYRQLPNMHFLGRRPYQQLPAYCRYLDIGLIPFKINRLTTAVNPIKLREYLAAGLPVISTPLPEVKLYAELIHVADSAEGFESAVIKCLAEPGACESARIDAMAKESWPHKMDLIYKALQDRQ